MCHVVGALAAYKRIITIAGCANIVLSFVSSFPSIIYDITQTIPSPLQSYLRDNFQEILPIVAPPLSCLWIWQRH